MAPVRELYLSRITTLLSQFQTPWLLKCDAVDPRHVILKVCYILERTEVRSSVIGRKREVKIRDDVVNLARDDQTCSCELFRALRGSGYSGELT